MTRSLRHLAPAAVLLVTAPGSAGCQSADDEAPHAAPAPSSTALPSPPGCPDAAALFLLVSAEERADGRSAAPGPASCSGDWALIGVQGPGYQSVALFRFADGRWGEVDRVAACAAGDVPADLVDGTCNAG